MKKQDLRAFLLLLLLPVILRIPAHAATVPYFTYSVDKSSAARGELVKLQINAGQVPDTAAGFRMRIGYHAEALSFVRTETSSQIKSGTMVTNSVSNPICSVYVCNVDQGAAPQLSGNIISFVFQVRDGASSGDTAINAHIDEVCNYAAKQLDVDIEENLTVSIEPPEEEPSDEAALSRLDPYNGELVPGFSPDVYQYRMSVGYTVESVEFYARAEEGGTVKINRKSLFKPGTDTPIVATVTSADKTNQVQYVVLVSRAEKPAGSAGLSSDPPRSGEKASGPEKTDAGKAQLPEKETEEMAAQGEDDFSAAAEAENPAQPQAVQTAAQPYANTGYGGRNIYIIGNQMPVYVNGMLTAALCILLGIALSLYLKIKPRE
ncbi:cadherin-like beta sandwich domain-containing protein [Caproiciproducens sp. CPB-2]|uniref:cadherin-like beta sandwich domain-containing protein n=1 Tax=Caproiciproducens sp. CPB-2 TaxID=3030017 RepID=UPI0023DC3794|nr:cadherin-like beta sandwich domain-containing protein [Caproiciproducens sp. CPB-2]MDF1493665.1 cadherin-like beta sandwich domain-containing protein [Caproiciproducens sp. CPB-2]